MNKKPKVEKELKKTEQDIEAALRDIKTKFGDEAIMMPVRPAIKNWNKKPMQNNIGVLNWILPPHMVPSQLKILIPVGTPTAMVVIVKKLLA